MIDTSLPTSAFASSLTSQRDTGAFAVSTESVAAQTKIGTSVSSKPKVAGAASSFVAPPRVGLERFEGPSPASLQPTLLLPFLRKDVNLASAASKWAQQTPPTLPKHYPLSPFSCVVDSLTPSEVLANLVEGFRRMSIHVRYQPPPGSVSAVTKHAWLTEMLVFM